MFGSESWILKSKWKERVGPQQKRYCRPTAGYTPREQVHTETIGWANIAEYTEGRTRIRRVNAEGPKDGKLSTWIMQDKHIGRKSERPGKCGKISSRSRL
jgi:hypothetical protein